MVGFLTLKYQKYTRKQIMNNIVIQYQAHQLLTNKNSLTEINREFMIIETPHKQKNTQPNKTEQTLNKKKRNLENLKRIMNRKNT